LRQAGAHCRLARGRLPRAALEDLAHDGVLRLARLDPGALERRADRDRAELGRGVRREAAAELAERRSHRGDDDASAHESSVLTQRRKLVSRSRPRAKAATSEITASRSSREQTSTGECM